MAVAHVTGHDIHKMCADGDKSHVVNKISCAKQNVKTESQSVQITTNDVLKTLQNNIVVSTKEHQAESTQQIYFRDAVCN